MKDVKRRILVVEDDEGIRMGLEENLKFSGYEVLTAANGSDALKQGLSSVLDLVLLDIMLPGMSGYEVCRKLRDAGKRMPVIMLTARGEEFDKLHGFEMGADDYVTKPFSIKELLARIKVVLERGSRAAAESPRQYEFGDCVLDMEARVLRRKVTSGQWTVDSKGMRKGKESGGKWEEVRGKGGREKVSSKQWTVDSEEGKGGKKLETRNSKLGKKRSDAVDAKSSEPSAPLCEMSPAWQEIVLTHTEFDLLAYFCGNEGKALSRDTVMNDVWGMEYYGTQRSLDSFVASLRAKIEKKASEPKHILTVHGVGYKFIK